MRPSQVAGSSDAKTTTENAGRVPRLARLDYPGYEHDGKIIRIVAEDHHWRWRDWDIGHKVEIKLRGFQSAVLISYEHIRELDG